MKNKEITIYELMGLIKDDKAPKSIMFDNEIYTLEEDSYCSILEEKYLFKVLNERFSDIEIPFLIVEILSEENEMKEMIYQKDSKTEVLYSGTYKNYEFYILNLGTHPTAYVNVENNSSLNRKHYNEIDIDVHGGLTYSKEYLYIDGEKKEAKGWFIGWDYAHYNDYGGYEINLPKELRTNGKKWTTEEIFEDVKSVIEQCINYKENDEWEDIEEYYSGEGLAFNETALEYKINQLIKNQKYLKERLDNVKDDVVFDYWKEKVVGKNEN